MSFGVKTLNKQGVETLTSDDRIMRLRHSVLVAPGVSGSIVLSDIAGRKTYEMAIMSPFVSDLVYVGDYGHQVSRSGTTISWSPVSITEVGIAGGATARASLILVFLYS